MSKAFDHELELLTLGYMAAAKLDKPEPLRVCVDDYPEIRDFLIGRRGKRSPVHHDGRDWMLWLEGSKLLVEPG